MSRLLARALSPMYLLVCARTSVRSPLYCVSFDGFFFVVAVNGFSYMTIQPTSVVVVVVVIAVVVIVVRIAGST